MVAGAAAPRLRVRQELGVVSEPDAGSLAAATQQLQGMALFKKGWDSDDLEHFCGVGGGCVPVSPPSPNHGPLFRQPGQPDLLQWQAVPSDVSSEA